MADKPAEFTSGVPLPAALLHRRSTPEELPFALSSELPDAPSQIGQDRAAEAVAA